MARLSNDNTDLVPRTSFTGPVLAFDFPALRVGVAEYDEGPTGCTVFHFPAGGAVATDVRGGSPAYIGDSDWADAICFAGGSFYGLEVVSGVAAELLAMRDYTTEWDRIAVVSGAIVFDLRGRDNAIYPDKALGRAALRAAQTGSFPLGPRGAGRSVTVGKAFDHTRREPAGQGGAFRQVGPMTIAVFTVVNAIGVVVDRQGQVVRGHRDPVTGARESAITDLERRLESATAARPSPGNTTLTLVATNQRLDARALTQLGRQVHSSMARAIQPFHAPNDGDVLFTVTTNEVEHPALTGTGLGVLASELAWDAVLSSFQECDPAAG